jgi:hypothetical protein
MRQFRVCLQRPDVRLRDLEAALGPEDLDVVFASAANSAAPTPADIAPPAYRGKLT